MMMVPTKAAKMRRILQRCREARRNGDEGTQNAIQDRLPWCARARRRPRLQPPKCVLGRHRPPHEQRGPGTSPSPPKHPAVSVRLGAPQEDERARRVEKLQLARWRRQPQKNAEKLLPLTRRLRWREQDPRALPLRCKCPCQLLRSVHVPTWNRRERRARAPRMGMTSTMLIWRRRRRRRGGVTD